LNIEYGKEYEYEEVKEIVRKKQIYILDTVVEICKQHGLVYWLDGGTLLGAVRHQGFIPWDDDIDIGLMRDDYEKLVKILPQELPSDLLMQDRKTDQKYKLPFVKIRDKYSQVEDQFKYNGIFIEIFPFDTMPKSSILKKIQRGTFMILEAMMIHTNIDSLNISKQKGFKVSIIKSAMRLFSKIGTLMGEKSFDFLYYNIIKLSKLSPSSEVGDGLSASWAYYKSIRDFADYGVEKEGTFNEKKYNIPKNYNKYLTTLYGENYMTPIRFDNIHLKKVIFFNQGLTI
jgi:lipopolysaccharide cholinephosphotransferase